MAADTVTDDAGDGSACDFETNWRVASGSLRRTVVFESSLEDYPLAADSSSNSVFDAFTPLVLKPDVADSGPCEIKLCFLQKHEIRQIYVRSTARVYEVYYTKSRHNDNEYLCTVRCSISEMDYEVCKAQDSSESTENSSAELKEDTVASEGNGGTSEDDWVDVKVLDSSLENKMNTLSSKRNSNTGSEIQHLYEATAEISDLDPCSSITIRFLSLQNRRSLCVDEVYVFSDPVCEIDSDSQVEDVKGSVGSSIMSLLAPTLLQFSKSVTSQICHQTSSETEKCSKIEIQSNPTDLTSDLKENGSNDQQSVNEERLDKSTTEPAETHLCTQVLGRNKSDNHRVKDGSAEHGHIEKVLEQLVSRVSRIEEVCLRFEENMLVPLRSMETRIQHVEQKLEELVNNSQNSEHGPCLKVSAPSFSWNSNSSSFHNDVQDCQPCRATESEKEEMTSGDIFNASSGIASSVNVSHLFPSLVVTAPEFSCEDDADDDGTKAPKISPQESKKKCSIDDFLAESLSRFLSTSTAALSEKERFPSYSGGIERMPVEESVQVSDGVDIIKDANTKEDPSRYTQVLTVTAPEFSYEENANEEMLYYAESVSVASPKFTSEIYERGKDINPEANEDVCAEVSSDFCDTSRERLVLDQPSSLSNMGSEKDCDSGPVSGQKTDDNHTTVDVQTIPEMPKASLVDFGTAILDVKFTSYEDFKSQLSLEDLLNDAINQQNVEEDISQRICGEDLHPQETNFIDIDESGKTGDSLAGKNQNLVLEGGIHNLIYSSTEESFVSDSGSTGEQENVASLI